MNQIWHFKLQKEIYDQRENIFIIYIRLMIIEHSANRSTF